METRTDERGERGREIEEEGRDPKIKRKKEKRSYARKTKKGEREIAVTEAATPTTARQKDWQECKEINNETRFAGVGGSVALTRTGKPGGISYYYYYFYCSCMAPLPRQATLTLVQQQQQLLLLCSALPGHACFSAFSSLFQCDIHPSPLYGSFRTRIRGNKCAQQPLPSSLTLLLTSISRLFRGADGRIES